MPKYVIEREIPGAGRMTEAELREAVSKSLGVIEDLGPGLVWLHSYVTDDKLYCVYLSPDEATIREHAHRVGAPASRVSRVRHLIDPINGL